MWESHPNFRKHIEEWWNIRVDGTAMYRLMQKLDNVRRNIKDWAKNSFGDIFKMKGEIENKLKDLQESMDKGDNRANTTLEEENYRMKWKDITAKEETFWKQRSRILWLEAGDRNTTFFHRSASIHKRRNTINSLMDDRGRVYKSNEEMGNHAVDYFCNALKEETKLCNPVIRRSMLNTVPRVLREIDNVNLLRNVAEEEVKNVVFSMKAFKAPGSDGFPPAFFQKFWEVIKKELIWATRDLFKTGKLAKRINKTFITLIPKSQSPEKMQDFRPISLCNTVYKVFAKVLINRIKPLLNKSIGTPQKGFVSGRQILDAMITTHEIIHSMEKCKKLGMALKLDISKAYDKVNWNFLYDVLERIGFSEKVMDIIKVMVSSV
jgi:hypothetical protein